MTPDLGPDQNFDARLIVDAVGRSVEVGAQARFDNGRSGHLDGVVRAVRMDGTVEIYDGTTVMYHLVSATQLRVIPLRRTPLRRPVRQARVAAVP